LRARLHGVSIDCDSLFSMGAPLAFRMRIYLVENGWSQRNGEPDLRDVLFPVHKGSNAPGELMNPRGLLGAGGRAASVYSPLKEIVSHTFRPDMLLIGTSIA
jgi:hypothetical protein